MTHTVKIASNKQSSWQEAKQKNTFSEHLILEFHLLLVNFCNSCNKERMQELTEQILCEEKNDMKDRVFNIARKEACMEIMSKCSAEVPSLVTDHVEADTKICYLTLHVLRENDGHPTVCVVRTSSGDTDIPIILLANEHENLKIIIDQGISTNRQFLDLSRCQYTELQKQALLSLHAFSGNDYVSSFF